MVTLRLETITVKATTTQKLGQREWIGLLEPSSLDAMWAYQMGAGVREAQVQINTFEAKRSEQMPWTLPLLTLQFPDGAYHP